MTNDSRHIFIIPDPKAFTSGGNLYNAHLMEALGSRAICWDWQTFAALLPDLSPGYYWFDTLYLEELRRTKLPGLVGVRWGMIIHHLESLFPPEEVNPDKVFLETEKPVLEQMHAFLTSSSFTSNYLSKKGLGDRKIITLPPALVVEPAEPADLPDIPFQALVVGNLVKRKGVFPLLEALARQILPEDPLVLRIAGGESIEPEYAKACHQMLESSPNLKGKVEILGELDPRLMRDLYARHHVFVSAAFMETFGMALQEAVASKRPILAYDGGNAAFHVHEGINGYLFKSHDTLAEKLLSLARHPLQLQKLNRSTQNFQPYENYSWEEVSRNFLNENSNLA